MSFMKSTFLLAAFVALSRAFNEPTPFARCRSVYTALQDGNALLLHAECPITLDGDDDTPRVQSSLDLNHCLLNQDNKLAPMPE